MMGEVVYNYHAWYFTAVLGLTFIEKQNITVRLAYHPGAVFCNSDTIDKLRHAVGMYAGGKVSHTCPHFSSTHG